VSDHSIDEFFDEVERRELDQEAADELLAEAREVYAPAPLSPEDPPAPTPPKPFPLRWLARLGAPDRLVTYPIWVLWVVAVHLVLLFLTVGTLLCVIALVAACVTVFLGVWPAIAVAVPFSVLATAGTFPHVLHSFRTKLSQYPW
jgi:hypothetical protein